MSDKHASPATPAADSITILTASGRFQAKRVHPGGRIDSVDPTRHFDMSEAHLRDLGDVAALLDRLAGEYFSCVVRGAIADPVRTRGVRRLLHLDPETGEASTLCDVPRWWVAFDIDGLPRPDDVHVADIAGCGRAAVARLPFEFHGCAAIVQATGSHGIKPGLRLRLWFWLDRPLSGGALKQWLRGVPVDRAVFGAVQIIYTASPIFLPGAVNPIPFRLAMLPGRAVVAVPLLPPPAPPPVCRPLPALTSGEGFVELTRAALAVAGAEEGTAHAALLKAAGRMARVVAAGALPAEAVVAVLVAAAERAGKPAEDAARVVAWALSRPLIDGMGPLQ